MEGRRITRPADKNPLFILFVGLVAAVAVLLIVAIVLGIRLGSANKKLAAAEKEVADLTEAVNTLQEQLLSAESRVPAPDDFGSYTPSGSAAEPSVPGSSSTGGSWLDLTGHSEVSVVPSSLLDSYATYYTTAGVNLRSGPSTSYERINTVELGTKVDVAAREGNWSFVRVEGKFGWINSDYLSTSQPSVQTSASSTRNSSSSSGKRTEATSGSLKKK